jgi:hypothetical protein
MIAGKATRRVFLSTSLAAVTASVFGRESAAKSGLDIANTGYHAGFLAEIE